MKKSFILFAASLLALAGCSRNQEIDIQENGLSLFARTESPADTKTVVESGVHVYWEPGDEIAVFMGEKSAKFTTDITTSSATATFKGTFGDTTWPEELDLWAVYPFSEDATFDGETITTTLPSEQIAREGSFGKDMNLSIAHSTSNTLQFYNVGGGIRFSVTEEGIKKVMFEGLSGEIISGKVKIGLEDGLPVVKEVTGGSQLITLLPPDGKETFEKDKWYYIIAIPGALEGGYRLRFFVDDLYADKLSTRAVNLKRSIFGSVTDADLNLEYNSSIIPSHEEIIDSIVLSKEEEEIQKLPSDEDCEETVISVEDSLAFDLLAQEIVEMNKTRTRSSQDDLAEEVILSGKSNNIFASQFDIEQVLWNAGDWGASHWGGFSCFYNTIQRGNTKYFVAVLFKNGGFTKNGTAYLKLGTLNTGKVICKRSVSVGQEYVVLPCPFESYVPELGCANFFPLIINNNGLRTYLNPIMVKSKPICSYNWKYLAFGEEFGTINGVSVFCNGDGNIGSGKYQCVELCKRYLKTLYPEINRSLTGDKWGNANQWPQKRRNDDKDPDKYLVFDNDGTNQVREGDIIVFEHGSYGHIGVVLKVTESRISIAHQNGGVADAATPIGTLLERNGNWILDRIPGGNKSPIFAKAGSISAFIRINHPAEHPQEIVDTPPSIRLSDTSVRFEETEVGEQSDEIQLSIFNDGDEDLKITVESCSDEFSCRPKVGTTDFTCRSNNSRPFYIRFSPTSTGAKNGKVVLRTNDPDHPTVTISLYGVGIEKNTPEDPQEAIDLGLPSGIKWASFNLGATKAEEYGNYYAWGETEPKDNYSLSVYKFANGAQAYTKYNTDSYYTYLGLGIIDNKTVLDPQDDAAHANLGSKWRIPTDAEWTELRENCSWNWTTENGVEGYKVISDKPGYTDKWIFLPAPGERSGTDQYNVGYFGYYWSSNLYTDDPAYAFSIFFSPSYAGQHNDPRYRGCSIRPVFGDR